MPIDLRSDTITRPTTEMRAAMHRAEVGDDVFREDPTVLALEERLAEILGLEAALFVPSGSMGNLLCLRCLGQPGDSVIAHEGAHIFNYESGSLCSFAGLQPLGIPASDGTFTAEQVRQRMFPPNIHHPRNRIVALENTHNRCGGTVWPIAQHRSVCTFAREHDLKVHLDGARLWNACAATASEPPQWTAGVDSVNVCFSKGLGAPIGSALAGSRELIEEALFFRKVLGGQMRQVGVIAAAALYALEHHRRRLVEDHENAGLLAELIDQAPGLQCIPPQSNIVIFEVTDDRFDAAQVVEAVSAEVLALAISERRIRVVTHLDVTREECAAAGRAFVRALESLAG